MAVNVLDKLGSVGAVFAGGAVPCCFPFLSLIGSAIGIGFLARYERTALYVMQGLVVLALVGSFVAYRGHEKVLPLLLAIASTAAVIYGVNSLQDARFIYPGLIGLLIVAVWNSIEARRCAAGCAPK